MKNLVCVCILLFFSSYIIGQQKHVIQPSNIEIHYNALSGRSFDYFILRCGKNVNQFYSLYNFREDSLESVNPLAYMDALGNMIDNMGKNSQKGLKTSPVHNEYLYRNMNEGKITVYSSVRGDNYRVEENIPNIDWNILADSIKTILEHNCILATTHFRGRYWKVWFTEDIPLPYGPGKLGGLPGLILYAQCENCVEYTACQILSENLTPITYYDFPNLSYQDISREQYVKIKNKPVEIMGRVFEKKMELEKE